MVRGVVTKSEVVLMADFEAPSFSLGLDSDRQIGFAIQNTHSNHLSTLKDEDFETLIVEEYPHPKRLRRLLTVPANTEPELHSTAVVDREDVDTFSLHDDEQIYTQNRKQTDSDTDDPSVTDGGSKSYSNRRQSDLLLHVGGLSKEQIVVFESTTENPWEDYRSMKHETHVVQANQSSHVTKISLDLDDSFPPAHRYFFHNNSRIQELVRNRLPNFSPLSNGNRDHHHPCTSTIDYKGQFSHGESSNRKNKDKKSSSSSSRKTSKRSKIEEESQGWVNPKLSTINKGLTKGTTKRKGYAVRQTAGHWFTDLDGKKVYVSKKGEELSGQIAYRHYRKESGAGLKKAKKRKSAKK